MARITLLPCRFFPAVVMLTSLLALLAATPAFADTIAVNGVTDALNGDTSSISALIADPGSDGVISLREAIVAANNTAGADTINFSIPVTGVHTIAVGSALPVVTDPITIDGLTQSGVRCSSWPPTLLIELSGASAGAGVDGLSIQAGSSTVRGLVINRFGGNGKGL